MKEYTNESILCTEKNYKFSHVSDFLENKQFFYGDEK